MTAPPAEVLAAAATVKAPADTPGDPLRGDGAQLRGRAPQPAPLPPGLQDPDARTGSRGGIRLSSGWAPWYEDKPTLRARVVAPGGRVFTLDPKTIETSGVSGGDEAVYSDRQMVRAPLPGVAVGAVVEVEISWTERAPLFEAGTTHRFFFGGTAPVQKARLEIDKPLSGMHLDHVVIGEIPPHHADVHHQERQVQTSRTRAGRSRRCPRRSRASRPTRCCPATSPTRPAPPGRRWRRRTPTSSTARSASPI